MTDGPVSDSQGLIRNPSLTDPYYDNNQLCLWRISAPPGYSILLEFDHFDLENDSYCEYDRLTVSGSTHRPIAIFCGQVIPARVLLQNSQNGVLLFSSDVNEAGQGFAVRHRAVEGPFPPACGTVVLVEDQVSLHTPNYPQSYSNDCTLRWVVYAPPGQLVKLEFTDFDLEESDRCLYDSLTVLGDIEGNEEIAVLCGAGIPPPVLSFNSLMVLHFTSDSSITHRGFRAALTFIRISDLDHEDGPVIEDQPHVFKAKQYTLYDSLEQRFSSKAPTQQGFVELKSSEDQRFHAGRASDHGGHSGESSGNGHFILE